MALIRKENILFSAVAKTLGQLNDPPIRRVLGKTLGLHCLGFRETLGLHRFRLGEELFHLGQGTAAVSLCGGGGQGEALLLYRD